MQRGLSPGRRIHREVACRGVLLRPRRQTGAQQRRQAIVNLLLVESVGDVRFLHQSAEPLIEARRRRRWRRRRWRGREFDQQLLQLGDLTPLYTARAVVLNQVDQAARRELVRVGKRGRPHRPSRVRGREPGAGVGHSEVRGDQPRPNPCRGDWTKVDSRRISIVRGRHRPLADQRPTIDQARHDDQRVLRVLGEIHEPGSHLVEQQLLLSTGKRPSERDQSVELVDRDEGRTPGGPHEPVECADDLPARNPPSADGMRPGLVDIDFQPLNQGISDVLMGEVFAVRSG